MQRTRILQHLIAALAPLVFTATSVHAADLVGKVTAVADGDTFTLCAGQQCEKIRLCGIDAPERGDALSAEATAALQLMIRGATVRCVPVGEGTVCDGRSRRRSGERLVAQCYVNGADIAAGLVSQGLACDWVRFSGGHYGQYPLGRACPPR